MKNKYERVIESLGKIKYQFPKDSVDRIFNLAIDCGIAAVKRVAEQEEIESLREVFTNAKR